MQKHEFERLTDMMVDEPTYSHAQDIYLNAGALTKEEVCREIKAHPWILNSQIVEDLTKNAQEQTRLAAARLVDIEKLKAALLDACGLADDDTTWRGAAELIGRAACIQYKLENEFGLNNEDVDYIRENLR